jgi:hypothetical protein
MNRLIVIFFAFLFLTSCSGSFLEENPRGSLDEFTLASAEGIDALLIGAYSMLDGTAADVAGWEAASSNWVFGSIRGLEANKGTDSGDSSPINPLQTFSENASNPYPNEKWKSVYEGISRCNTTILVAGNALETGSIDQQDFDKFIRQARVLRGWFHFEAWRMWAGMVPYIDETVDPATVPNTIDIRQNIIDDLTEGIGLDLNMGQVGRFNKTVSQVLLSRALIQMYDNRWSDALDLLEDVIANGRKPDGSPIGLAPTYGEIFEIENRNGIESVYTIQYSVNDGSGGWNGG